MLAPLLNHYSVWLRTNRGTGLQETHLDSFRASANPSDVADALRASARLDVLRGELRAAKRLNEESAFIAAQLGVSNYLGELQLASAMLRQVETGDLARHLLETEEAYTLVPHFLAGWEPLLRGRDKFMSGSLGAASAASAEYVPTAVKWQDEPVLALQAKIDLLASGPAAPSLLARAAKPPPTVGELFLGRTLAVALDVEALAHAANAWDWDAALDLALGVMAEGCQIVDHLFGLMLRPRIAAIAAGGMPL